MCKKLLILLFAFICTQQAWAQTRTITGKVVENNKDKFPIPNAYIVSKANPSRGTVTDFDGNYSLKLTDADEVVIFKYTGFRSQEVVVGTRNVINIALDEDVKLMNEAVVTGFRSEKKVESTANIATVKGEVFQNTPTPSFDAALQGRAPGLQITQSSGVAGAGVTVRVRGQGSASAASEPLYVIDGVPVISGGGGDGGGGTGGINAGFQLNPLADFNPADIESLEVLKDAAATAQYGSRGSNGVIVITTRKGKAGRTKFNFTYYTGMEQVTNKVESLNGPEYLGVLQSAYENSFNSNPNSANRQISGLGAYLTVPLTRGLTEDAAKTTDVSYLDYILRAGRINEASLNASGGDAKTTFYVNGTSAISRGP